jgi:methylthioribulose-1-phosphate dehydratase
MNLPSRVEGTDARPALLELARMAHARGWTYATSGNFSCRLSGGRIAVTASSRDKGRLTLEDLVLLDESGVALDKSGPPASAEAPLHVAIYRLLPEVTVVAHTHSVAAVVLSRRFAHKGAVELAGYEMLKALSGVSTHEHTERLPVFANTQEPATLAGPLERALAEGPIHGFLVEGHGMYTWGGSAEEARRHLEGLEFLAECRLHEPG